MFIIKLLLFVLFGIVFPYIIGAIPVLALNKIHKSIPLCIASGYVCIWGVFDIIALAGILLKMSLTTLTAIYVILILLAVLFSIYINRMSLILLLKDSIESTRPHLLLFLLAVGFIAFQTIFVAVSQHIDDDDAFYVATAETAVATDTLMKYNPYSGEEYSSLPSRYVLSPFPFFHAVSAKIIGVKPVVYAHTLFPLLMIPLGYMIYYLLSCIFWKDNTEARFYFLILLSFVMMYSGYSVYTQGTFFLIRIWQGKAVLAGILLPFILYFGMIIRNSTSSENWFVLFMLLTSCCLVSSMGIMLGAIMLGIIAIINLLMYRKIRTVLNMLICCIPNILFALIYLFIR